MPSEADKFTDSATTMATASGYFVHKMLAELKHGERGTAPAAAPRGCGVGNPALLLQIYGHGSAVHPHQAKRPERRYYHLGVYRPTPPSSGSAVADLVAGRPGAAFASAEVRRTSQPVDKTLPAAATPKSPAVQQRTLPGRADEREASTNNFGCSDNMPRMRRSSSASTAPPTAALSALALPSSPPPVLETCPSAAAIAAGSSMEPAPAAPSPAASPPPVDPDGLTPLEAAVALVNLGIKPLGGLDAVKDAVSRHRQSASRASFSQQEGAHTRLTGEGGDISAFLLAPSSAAAPSSLLSVALSPAALALIAADADNRRGSSGDGDGPGGTAAGDGSNVVHAGYTPYAYNGAGVVARLGAPPPQPLYVPNVERNQHFVQPRGAEDFSAHYRFYPSFPCSKDVPPPARSQLYVTFLASQARGASQALQEAEARWRPWSASGGSHSRTLHTTLRVPSPADAGATRLQQSRSLLDTGSRASRPASPSILLPPQARTRRGLPPGSASAVRRRPQALEDNAALSRRPASAPSAAAAPMATSQPLVYATPRRRPDTREEVGDRRAGGGSATGEGNHQQYQQKWSRGGASTAPSASPGCGRPRPTSAEVARCGSAARATEELREARRALKCWDALDSERSRHPNQLYTHV